MDKEHPKRATQAEHGEEARSPPRNVHWGAVAGAVLLGLGALLRKRRPGAPQRGAGAGAGAGRGAPSTRRTSV